MSKVTASPYLSNLGDDICGPFFDHGGVLHVMSQNSGTILRLDTATGRMTAVHNTAGQPNGAAFDASGQLYVTDFGHGAILSVQEDGSQDSVVAVYEDRPLKGPNSVTIDRNGNVFFTDSGPEGETGLASPSGSVFCIANSPGGQILRPVSLGNLAYPSGITVDGKFMCVSSY